MAKKLADTIQDSLIANVDPDNHRVAKANESYYLLEKNTHTYRYCRVWVSK